MKLCGIPVVFLSVSTHWIKHVPKLKTKQSSRLMWHTVQPKRNPLTLPSTGSDKYRWALQNIFCKNSFRIKLLGRSCMCMGAYSIGYIDGLVR